MTQKTAMITGMHGQDGYYLTELLSNKGYRVIGISRADYLNIQALSAIIRNTKPDEIYNLAAQSHPGESWNISLETGESTALAAHRLFEVVRQEHPTCRIYQASSSEIFGVGQNVSCDEKTLFHPLNPYAVAKVYAHQMAALYRKHYGMFISAGILFNHESPRRGLHFITQKVTYGAACIKLGMHTSPELNERGEPIIQQGKLALGNLDAKRDWGYAGDYVEAMWLMLQQETPDEFVIGTGQAHTIRELCELAFSLVSLNWEDHVIVDPRLIRPIETGSVIADTTKAQKILGWRPTTSFETLIQLMIQANLNKLQRVTN